MEESISFYDHLIVLIPIVLFILIMIVAGKKESKRCKEIEEYALGNGLEYTKHVDGLVNCDAGFKFFELAKWASVSYGEMVRGLRDDVEFQILDFSYSRQSGRYRQTFLFTLCVLKDGRISRIPSFFMRKEQFLFDFLGSILGGQDIDFKEDYVFSERFVLQGNDEIAIRKFFNARVRQAFVDQAKKKYFYEVSGNYFLVAASDTLDNEQRLKFLDDVFEIYNEILLSENILKPTFWG